MQDSTVFNLILRTMDVFSLPLQKPEKLQAGLEVGPEARLAAGQAAAGAVMRLTLIFQKFSLCAQMRQKLFIIPQADRHPGQVLGRHPASPPKSRLRNGDPRPAN